MDVKEFFGKYRIAYTGDYTCDMCEIATCSEHFDKCPLPEKYVFKLKYDNNNG